MATPQELLEEQKQKQLDAKVDQAAKDVKTRDTKENEDAVKAIKKEVDLKLKTKGGYGVLSELATLLES